MSTATNAETTNAVAASPAAPTAAAAAAAATATATTAAPVRYAFHGGDFVDVASIKLPLNTQALHYGTGVFEGIRAYETEAGTAVFRHYDHLNRLQQSARLYYLPMPFGLEEIRAATNELIRRNGLDTCYIRPLVFRGYGEMGLFAESPVEVIVAAWHWGAYLGEESKQVGVRAKVSSWRRISPDGLIPSRIEAVCGGVRISPSRITKMFSPEPSQTSPRWSSRIASS